MRDWWRASVAVLLGWLLVVAGGGALAFIWFGRDSFDPVDSAQVIGTVVALVVMVSGGCAVLWRWSRSGIAERRSTAAQFVPGSSRGRLPRLGQVELNYLGVRVPRENAQASLDQLPYASRRLMDPALRTTLRESRFVLVHGPSASGKSRSTAEAARVLYGDRPVLVPAVRPGALTELLAAKVISPRTVVWLDDIDRHLGAGVDAGVLQSLLALDGVIVVATIRAAAYEDIKPQGELRPPGSDVLDLARFHRGLIRFTGWDAPDREQAAEQYADQPDVVSALNRGMGLGEYLAAGPELIERVEAGDPPAGGVAVVRAAADWYRVGLTRPAPVHLIRNLYPLYLPPNDASLLNRFEDALQWACTPVSGARLLTHLTDGTGLAVHDYYLDHVAGRSLDTIPPPTWDAIAEELADAPADLSLVGVALYDRGDSMKAEFFFRPAATAGYAIAMTNLGVVLVERGDLVEAERWYRAAAEADHSGAMHNLGNLLVERGDLVEAEHWYRAAAETSHIKAMYNLGFVLKERGEVVEAERWYRAAADAGHASAMNNLGRLLTDRGDLAEAEHWYRAAADIGQVDAMNNLGAVLREWGDLVEAERWFRAAADTGDADAMYNLGFTLREQGNLVEAERWYRAAADTGHGRAMYNLGLLLKERGDLVGAEHWYHSAADTGHLSAMYNLGLLLKRRGDLVEAERWYRAAADTGHTDAMVNLGILLKRRGDLMGAERWYRAAAGTGNASAMHNLGFLLEERGDLVEAERWYHSAADTGLTAAMNNLGILLEDRAELMEAERWYRAAADAGYAKAMHNLESLLNRRGSR